MGIGRPLTPSGPIDSFTPERYYPVGTSEARMGPWTPSGPTHESRTYKAALHHFQHDHTY